MSAHNYQILRLSILSALVITTSYCELVEFRNLQAEASSGEKKWHNLKLFFDVSGLNKIKELHDGEDIYSELVDVLIPSAMNFLRSTYQVYSDGSILLDNSDGCGGDDNFKFSTPKKINGDFVLFFYFLNQKDLDEIASAIPCKYNSEDGRPTAGDIRVNLAHMNNFSKGNAHNNFITLIHEFHHSLGFFDVEYENFVFPETSLKRGEDTFIKRSTTSPFLTWITYPPIVEWARIHYGCNSVMGIPLENGGGDNTAGSHWEKTITGNEFMGPDDFYDARISKLTLLMMELTGWYRANFEMEEELEWGKNSGCAIFDGKCNTHPMMCDSNTKSGQCSPNFNSIGSCNQDYYVEGCKIFHKSTGGDCRVTENIPSNSDVLSRLTYGSHGRCIMSQLREGRLLQTSLTPNCLSVTCTGSNKVTIVAGSDKIDCTKKGLVNTPTDRKGRRSEMIYCPDPVEFCKQEQLRCPDNCNMNGRCLKSKTCFCYTGFSGTSCEKFTKQRFSYGIEDSNSNNANNRTEFNRLGVIGNSLVAIIVILCSNL